MFLHHKWNRISDKTIRDSEQSKNKKKTYSNANNMLNKRENIVKEGLGSRNHLYVYFKIVERNIVQAWPSGITKEVLMELRGEWLMTKNDLNQFKVLHI